MNKINEIIDVALTVLFIMSVSIMMVDIICSLIGNPSEEYNENTRCIESYIDLEVICKNGSERICYDRKTNVLYYRFSGATCSGITPILNSDGTPRLYKEE